MNSFVLKREILRHSSLTSGEICQLTFFDLRFMTRPDVEGVSEMIGQKEPTFSWIVVICNTVTHEVHYRYLFHLPQDLVPHRRIAYAAFVESSNNLGGLIDLFFGIWELIMAGCLRHRDKQYFSKIWGLNVF